MTATGVVPLCAFVMPGGAVVAAGTRYPPVFLRCPARWSFARTASCKWTQRLEVSDLLFHHRDVMGVAKAPAANNAGRRSVVWRSAGIIATRTPFQVWSSPAGCRDEWCKMRLLDDRRALHLLVGHYFPPDKGERLFAFVASRAFSACLNSFATTGRSPKAFLH